RDGCHRTPERETLLGCHGNELRCALIQRSDVSDEREQYVAERQARSQRRRMRQPPSLSDCCAALCHCLIRKTEREQDNVQMRLACPVRVGSCMIYKRGVGQRTIKNNPLRQLRWAGPNPAANEPVSTGG